jgi:hypothetical protein
MSGCASSGESWLVKPDPLVGFGIAVTGRGLLLDRSCPDVDVIVISDLTLFAQRTKLPQTTKPGGPTLRQFFSATRR